MCEGRDMRYKGAAAPAGAVRTYARTLYGRRRRPEVLSCKHDNKASNARRSSSCYIAWCRNVDINLIGAIWGALWMHMYCDLEKCRGSAFFVGGTCPLCPPPIPMPSTSTCTYTILVQHCILYVMVCSAHDTEFTT